MPKSEVLQIAEKESKPAKTDALKEKRTVTKPASRKAGKKVRLNGGKRGTPGAEKREKPAVKKRGGKVAMPAATEEFSSLKYMHGMAEFYKPFSFFQQLNTHSFLCIDIDSDKVRYLTGKSNGSQVQVTDWGVKMTPVEEGERYKALKIAIDNIKATKYKKGQQVYVCFFSPDITVRQFVLPKMRKQGEFKNALFYKLQGELPGFNEKSTWRYKVLEEFSEDNIRKARVLTVVVPEDVIVEHMELFESSGLTPQCLVPRQVALSNVFRHFVNKSEEEILVDISYELTHVSYLNNGELEYTRNIASGAANLEMAIHDNKGNLLGPDMLGHSDSDGIGPDGALKPEKIREVLRARLKALQHNQSPALQLFRSELQNSIDYFNSLKKGRNISRVFVTGYGVQKESLISFLKKNFGLPVFILAPKFQAAEENRSRHGEFSAALGALINTEHPFNMVPGEVQAQARFKRFNAVAAIIFVMVMATMGYLSFFTNSQIEGIQTRFDQITRQYNKINPARVEYQRLNNEIAAIQARKAGLVNSVAEETPLLDVMRLLSNETNEDIILNEITFSHHQATQTRGRRMGRRPATNENSDYDYVITLSGTVNGDYLNSDVILINFIDHLKDLNYFKNIEIDEKNKRNVRQRLEFELKAYL